MSTVQGLVILGVLDRHFARVARVEAETRGGYYEPGHDIEIIENEFYEVYSRADREYLQWPTEWSSK